MTATVVYQGDLECTLTHMRSGQVFTTDAPTDNQGKGAAFSPTDLMATSLAACALTTMGISARNHGLKMDGAKAEVFKVMSGDKPRRIVQIEVDLYMPAEDYGAHGQEILMRAAEGCPVAKSLHPEVQQIFRWHWAAPANG